MTGSLITSCVIGHTYSAGHPVFVRCIVNKMQAQRAKRSEHKCQTDLLEAMTNVSVQMCVTQQTGQFGGLTRETQERPVHR